MRRWSGLPALLLTSFVIVRPAAAGQTPPSDPSGTEAEGRGDSTAPSAARTDAAEAAGPSPAEAAGPESSEDATDASATAAPGDATDRATGSSPEPAAPSAEPPATTPALPEPVPPEPEPPDGDDVRPARHVELGATVGVWSRPAQGNGDVSYSAGPAWGGYARIDVRSWLGLRALVLGGTHPVSPSTGALGPASDTRVRQDDLAVTVMSLHAEPSLTPLPRLRLWLGLGTGWGTIVAAAPEARGEDIRSARRTGVLVEISASLGGSYEIIPDWLTASLTLSGGLPVEQSGDIFRSVQALRQDPAATTIEYYEPLPEFAGTLSGVIAIGLLL